MSMFNVGDFVRIKQDAETISPADKSIGFALEMKEFLSKCFYVEKIFDKDTDSYYLKDVEDKIDGYKWTWDKNWLELVEPDKQINIHENDLMEVFGNE